MFYTASPTADAERFFDAQDAAASREEAQQARYLELISGDLSKIVVKGTMTQVQYDAADLITEALDVGTAPKTTDLVKLLIEASNGKDIEVAASELLGRMAKAFTFYYPEVSEAL